MSLYTKHECCHFTPAYDLKTNLFIVVNSGRPVQKQRNGAYLVRCNIYYIFIGLYNSYRVTEFRYGKELGDVIRKNNNQRLAYLRNFGTGWGFIDGLSAVAFVDNHDNQRGQ